MKDLIMLLDDLQGFIINIVNYSEQDIKEITFVCKDDYYENTELVKCLEKLQVLHIDAHLGKVRITLAGKWVWVRQSLWVWAI